MTDKLLSKYKILMSCLDFEAKRKAWHTFGSNDIEPTAAALKAFRDAENQRHIETNHAPNFHKHSLYGDAILINQETKEIVTTYIGHPFEEVS